MRLSYLLMLPVLAGTALTSADTVTVQLMVDNVRSNTGSLVARAYNKDNWLSDEPSVRSELPLKGLDLSKPVAIALQVASGEQAFAVYHDEDGNGKLNSNFIGLPSEPVGLSNDHRPRFGPPRYKKAKVLVTPTAEIFPIRLD